MKKKAKNKGGPASTTKTPTSPAAHCRPWRSFFHEHRAAARGEASCHALWACRWRRVRPGRWRRCGARMGEVAVCRTRGERRWTAFSAERSRDEGPVGARPVKVERDRRHHQDRLAEQDRGREVRLARVNAGGDQGITRRMVSDVVDPTDRAPERHAGQHFEKRIQIHDKPGAPAVDQPIGRGDADDSHDALEDPIARPGHPMARAEPREKNRRENERDPAQHQAPGEKAGIEPWIRRRFAVPGDAERTGERDRGKKGRALPTRQQQPAQRSAPGGGALPLPHLHPHGLRDDR